MLSEGAAFPDRVLSDLEGRPHRASEAWSQGVALVVVGHAECGTTSLALPYVDRLHARRGPQAGVVAVLQEDAAGALALASALSLSLPLLLDEHPYPLASQLGLETVPAFFLVGMDGRVVRTAEGYSRDDLEAFAAALGLAGPLFGAAEEGPRFRPG